MKIATRIGQPRHLRGLGIGLGAALLFTFVVTLITAPDAFGAILPGMLLLIGVPVYSINAHVSEKMVLQQALKLAQQQTPNFTIGRQLLGVKNASGILLDAQHGQFMVFEDHGKRHSILPYAGLMQCEIVEDGHAVSVMSTNRGSQLLGAAVGGLAFGGVGAVVGALTGRKTSQGSAMLSELALRLTVEDEITPTFRVVLFSVNKPVAKTSKLAKQAVRSAEDASALIAIVMRKAAGNGIGGPAGQIGGPRQNAQLAPTQPMELS